MIAARTGLLLRPGIILCLTFLGLAASRPARAAAFTTTLEYAARPGCPDATELKAIVSARLGYDPFTDNAPDHVLVRISARGGSLDGHIEWRDSTGRWAGDQTFSLVSADCLPLLRAVGFALAVQIQLLAKANESADSHIAVPAEPRPPAPNTAPPTPAKPPDVARPASEPAPVAEIVKAAPSATPGPPPVFALGAGPSVGFGMSSAPVWLGRVFGTVAWRRVSLELAAQTSVPATTRRPDGAGVSQQYLLLNAAACAPLGRWNACLVANAGEVRMVGEIDRPSSASLPIFEAGARAGLLQPIGRRAFLSAHADGLVVLTRWIATLDQVPVWTSPRVAAIVAVDGGVRFP